MQKPPLPKRLAAQIRAAQEKVEAAQYSLIYDDERIEQDASRIAEYEANPALFANRHYGNKLHNSYPVQTNISRCRERLERLRARRKESIDELSAAAANLKLVEDQVLQEVNRMRPDTPGRVPWPRAPRSLAELRHIESLINEREEREYQRQRTEEDDHIESEIRKEDRIARLEEDAFHQQWQEELAKMDPDARHAAKRAVRKIKEKIESGDVTVAQIIEYLRHRGG